MVGRHRRARLTYVLAKAWRLVGYFDVGAGGSRLTWQAKGAVDWRLSRVLSLEAGYRHFYFDRFANDTSTKMAKSGPYTRPGHQVLIARTTVPRTGPRRPGPGASAGRAPSHKGDQRMPRELLTWVEPALVPGDPGARRSGIGLARDARSGRRSAAFVERRRRQAVHRRLRRRGSRRRLAGLRPARRAHRRVRQRRHAVVRAAGVRPAGVRPRPRQGARAAASRMAGHRSLSRPC